MMRMKNTPHPGLSVQHDCLEPLGLSVAQGADALGVTEMAIRLDKAFGGGAETWLRLQAVYDLAQAQKHAGKIKVRRVA
jgi:plasmid maintenance system antidote protein VapI